MILLFVISQLFIYWFVYIFHRTPGHGGRGGPPPVRIDLKISHQEVELQKAENAWKPKDKGIIINQFHVKNVIHTNLVFCFALLQEKEVRNQKIL